jgi:hypothetical protein|tara:strand:- start:46 stop:309 length:264 start_codon:yes stop_codon:yes gene_type:complete
MAEWRTSENPLIIPAGAHHSTDSASIVVDPGSGNVQVQIMDASDTWFTPADASYTLDAADVHIMPRRNRPETRIIATDDAQFYVIGS